MAEGGTWEYMGSQGDRWRGRGREGGELLKMVKDG